MENLKKISDKANSKPLQQCSVSGSAFKSFIDVYQLPFHRRKLVDNWIYDKGNNFCFQFEKYRDELNILLLQVINGDRCLENENLTFHHKDGEIIDNKGNHLITIRGWGNLTSPNCLGFSTEEAANIQDTLAEFIVEQLNKRDIV